MKCFLLLLLFTYIGCAVNSCRQTTQKWMQVTEREKGYNNALNVVIVPLP